MFKSWFEKIKINAALKECEKETLSSNYDSERTARIAATDSCMERKGFRRNNQDKWEKIVED